MGYKVKDANKYDSSPTGNSITKQSKYPFAKLEKVGDIVSLVFDTEKKLYNHSSDSIRMAVLRLAPDKKCKIEYHHTPFITETGVMAKYGITVECVGYRSKKVRRDKVSSALGGSDNPSDTAHIPCLVDTSDSEAVRQWVRGLPEVKFLVLLQECFKRVIRG